MLPKCTAPEECACTSKRNDKQSNKTRKRWRNIGVASIRKNVFSNFGCVLLTAILLIQISNSCQSSNYNHGGFPDGDPAPGRSPGPPGGAGLGEAEARVPPDYEESPPGQPTAPLMAERNDSDEVTEQFEIAKAGNASAVNSNLKQVSIEKSDNVILESWKCNVKSDDFEGDVRLVEKEVSGLNLTFGHAVFKSDVELVRGVVYDVTLIRLGGDQLVEIFSVESLVNGEERGDFSLPHEEDFICISHLQKKPPTPPSFHQHPRFPDNDKRKPTFERLNKTLASNQLPLDDYDINTEKNDVPVWENLSVDTQNEILDDYKLENDSHNRKIPINEEIVVNTIVGKTEGRHTLASVVNNSKTEPQNGIDQKNVKTNIKDNDNPSLESKNNDVNSISSESVKRREVYKRDATNYIYPAEDSARVPGLFVERGAGRSATQEVAVGPRVLGRLPSDRSSIQLNWRLRDARLGEERTANVTFRLRYRLTDIRTVYQVVFTRILNFECQLSLYRSSGRLSWNDIPRSPTDCQVFFPAAAAQKHGLLVTLERLNVPCVSGGFIRLNPGSPPSARSRANSHNHSHLCGKLEELPEAERTLYISASETKASPYLHVHGTPSFVISYRLVDYCYNVTLTARNGSFEIEPTNSLHCTFRIHLPYGNRVALRLQMGERAVKLGANNPVPESTTLAQSSFNNDILQDLETEYSTLLDSREAKVPECLGLSIKLWDGTNSWVHCSKSGDPLRNVQIISKENNVILYVLIRRTSKSVLNNKSDDSKVVKENVVKLENSDRNLNSNNVFIGDDRDGASLSNESEVTKRSASSELEGGDSLGLFLKLWYHSEPLEEVVGGCSYGWVGLRQFCVAVFEHARLPWAQAEAECVRQGGHLVSIRSEQDQAVIDELLIQSPGYREQNAYWVGASDRASEGDFRWSDGLPFSFTHWFPGWAAHGGYNRQPNDDGLSAQDCVELRRTYSPPPPAPPSLAHSHRWNDRDCGAPNFYVCERPLADEPTEILSGPACEAVLQLSRARPRAQLTSPGFPRAYPDGAHCETAVTAPPGYRVVLDFEELVLEQEPDCSYDFLEIWEPVSSNQSVLSGGDPPPAAGDPPDKRRLCGDWSSRLKLLRHVSRGPRLHLRFESDYSHHYTGFKATLTMENVMECSDDRQRLFNESCYLIVSYPEVTWSTAQQICRGARAELASILSAEEEKFLTATIRNSAEYSNSAIYWLGAKISGLGTYDWSDGTRVTFSGWLPGRSPEEMDVLELPDSENPTCLGIQWMTSPTPMLPSGLYWTTQKCAHVGGYVCKRKNQLREPNLKLNKTINDTEGRLVSPNYPGTYPNNLEYFVKLVGPESTRLVIQFSKMDMEFQKDCLYDYVEIRSLINGVAQNDPLRTCGSHDTDMLRFDFVSQGRGALVAVKSDYSLSGGGFSARWRAVDVSACPGQTLTARHGIITSPNWPYFLLAKLDCTFTIIAPPGKRVWLEITEHSLGAGSALEVSIGAGAPLRPFLAPEQLADGAFLSLGEALALRLRTGDHPEGKGFTAVYKIVGFAECERVIQLGNASAGSVLHVNYPRAPPPAADLSVRLLSPQGYSVLLRLHAVRFSDGDCAKDRGKIEVFDSYADVNGTWWGLCEDEADSPASVSITSYFNSLRIRQRSNSIGVQLNATVSTQIDVSYRTKLMQVAQDAPVESCRPNPCLNGGRCLSNGGKSSCQCFGHFTGLFCALTACELEPCVFGACTLTAGGHRCTCRAGYTGAACETRVRPCEARPCEGRGRCTERPHGFHCNCYAWWEGTRCERRMMNIPYRPLSERMLQEPFWLGLITVFVVLAIIGLVWCAKRHFPEKIEKLLTEEADRNRPNHLSLRQSAREAAMCQGAAALAVSTPSSAGAGPAGPARASLFNRLGIRKPSILSLSPGPVPAARTFSLDDLLRPPPRRTPSPRKKRNNSTPTKKNAAEKKQILQQLINPSSSQNHARKVSMGELIQMSERRVKDSEDSKLGLGAGLDRQETSFVNGDMSAPSTSTDMRQLNDPKLEKKVTFARLLNKVSAEMSSGSEIEMGGGLSVSQNGRTKSASTPPSPAADSRSPHSNSSNQGSDSMSSLEAALPGMGLRKFAGRANKISSADSILAMFRNFSSTSTGLSMPASIIVSPSTTPSASSPQDDIAGDDDSSSSSIHTPVSLSSGAPDSPVYYRQSNSQSTTIEVPVLDVLTAHKANISGCNLLHPPTILLEIPSSINKCLSPIRELPTPLPSPALTPIMHRSQPSIADYEDLGMDVSDDHISLEMPLSQSEDENDEVPSQNISVFGQEGVLGGPTEFSRTNTNGNALKHKVRLSPIGRDTPTPSTQMTDDSPSPLTQSHDSDRELSSSCGRATASPRDLSPSHPKLVIPLLIVEQPSPTRHYPSGLMFAGSPPPQRASIGETSFHFPNKQQQKRLLKEFEKPSSLDLAMAPPLITITCNMSEAESDADSVSPATRAPRQSLAPPGPSTMCYLSPFSICTRGDRTISDSNLSSSGYSSMASPGPSRCGSNNPLCPSEMEDPGSGPMSLHPALAHRRPSPLLKTNSNPSPGTSVTNNPNEQKRHCRGRSDSETLSDDPLLESNDEGISTDHLEERIEDVDLKSAKELEVFLKNEMLDSDKATLPVLLVPSLVPTKCITKCDEKGLDRLMIPTSVAKMSLQLPSIVIQSDSSTICDKLLSPVSSRSESPLSDRTTGVGRFSPHFYGRHKDQLPFTDSDGLYDFPSSDCIHQNSSGSSNKVNMVLTAQPHRKSNGRRRERKIARNNTGSKTPSPTKAQLPHSMQNLLDVPGKDVYFRTPTPRKLSPKRRSRSQQPVSSSSSSESINSAREVTIRLSPDAKSPQATEGLAGAWPKQEWAAEASGEETGEDVSARMLPKSPAPEEAQKPVRKISRMRTIGHQIRFLRRLEQSLKQRERFTGAGNSDEEGDESSSVTSPLLQQSRAPRPQIRKSQSIGRLQPALPPAPAPAPAPAPPRQKITRQKKGELLHSAAEGAWRGSLGMAGPNDISD